MTPDQRALLERIQDYSPDDPASALRFSDRLRRENAWHPVFTDRVLEEYRRFMFLAVVAGHPVTPSDPVDQVWHLHLVYTREYWGRFCAEVLRREVHHGPTTGGAAASERYEQWYERTLQSYEAWFGDAPPPDIWPPSEIRFGEDLAHRRVNVDRTWVISRPEWTRRLRAWLRRAGSWRAPIVGAFLALPVLGDAQASSPLDWEGASFLKLFGGMFVVSAGAAAWIRRAFRPWRGAERLKQPDQPLGGEEIAFLKGGPGLALQAVVCSLLEHEVLELKSAKIGKGPRALANPTPLEQRIVDFVESVPGGVTLTALADAAEAELLKVEHELIEQKLLLSTQQTLRVRLGSVALLGLTLALGLAKIAVGLSRDRPVGLLTLGCFVVAGVIFWLARNYPRESRQGERRLAALRSRFGSAADVRGADLASAGLRSRDADGTATMVALFGLGAVGIGSTAYEVLDPPKKKWDSFASGCGGCGGGGGDAGCSGGGGCGGCGD